MHCPGSQCEAASRMSSWANQHIKDSTDRAHCDNDGSTIGTVAATVPTARLKRTNKKQPQPQPQLQPATATPTAMQTAATTALLPVQSKAPALAIGQDVLQAVVFWGRRAAKSTSQLRGALWKGSLGNPAWSTWARELVPFRFFHWSNTKIDQRNLYLEHGLSPAWPAPKLASVHSADWAGFQLRACRVQCGRKIFHSKIDGPLW